MELKTSNTGMQTYVHIYQCSLGGQKLECIVSLTEFNPKCKSIFQPIKWILWKDFLFILAQLGMKFKKKACKD